MDGWRLRAGGRTPRRLETEADLIAGFPVPPGARAAQAHPDEDPASHEAHQQRQHEDDPRQAERLSDDLPQAEFLRGLTNDADHDWLNRWLHGIHCTRRLRHVGSRGPRGVAHRDFDEGPDGRARRTFRLPRFRLIDPDGPRDIEVRPWQVARELLQ